MELTFHWMRATRLRGRLCVSLRRLGAGIHAKKHETQKGMNPGTPFGAVLGTQDPRELLFVECRLVLIRMK
jgi:hypothetical protein